MTLQEFAIKCGVTLVECDPEWGGRIGYKEVRYPNSTTCGFKSKTAAYKSWFESNFGEQASRIVLKLLKDSEKWKHKKKTVSTAKTMK